ncbi:restriction endonuclease subunit S [Elizabethkingia sp. 2-6]|uniref:restriction endonuclease subunit S n=1 Tax=Elizabethkingia sp. 2-6 TaxID=2575699 RepID=UPI0010C1801A|nr:restriction endonuclease subunit S [Elizabethkingia sp. 2-6]QCO47109.1 restriction endonuclease subunit S [Elizabethkingia sp. 2-6]
MRFPEFTEEWQSSRLADTCEINPKNEGLPSSFVYIDLESVENGRLLKEDFISKDGAPSRAQRVLSKNDVLFQMVRPYQKNNLFFDKEGKYVASTGYAQIRTKQNSRFIFQYLHNQKFVDNVIERCTGTSYPAINSTDLGNIRIGYPSLEEQTKIASFLSLIDERIQTQNKIIEELKLLKNTLRYQLYEQILNQENEYVQVKDTLNYEQPTKYLVTNTDYSSDISLIPVLTANKAFVLGYTDEEFGIYDKGQCIIFDDFTMDIKFVNFPFKVKSSAIKILTAKPNVNLKFIFEYLSFLNLSSNEHKRHYISEIEPLKMQLPNYIQQTYVANFLASIDDKIKTEFEIHTLLLKQKQYLLANLFI